MPRGLDKQPAPKGPECWVQAPEDVAHPLRRGVGQEMPVQSPVACMACKQLLLRIDKWKKSTWPFRGAPGLDVTIRLLKGRVDSEDVARGKTRDSGHSFGS